MRRPSMILTAALAAVLGACDDPTQPVPVTFPRHSVSAGDITITVLPTLGGGDDWADDINDRGEIVGGGLAPDGTYHAAHWSPSTGLSDLGRFGAREAWATAINEIGQVLVLAESGAGPQPILWSPATGARPFSVDGYVGDADLNDFGQVAGSRIVGRGEQRAFLWSGGTILDLGNMGGYASGATSINNNGSVAGFSAHSDWTRSFLWTGDHGMTALPMPAGITHSAAIGVNYAAHVVGYLHGADHQVRPFLWTAETGTIDLGLPPGLTFALALAINDAGEIIGWGYAGPGAPRRAWLRTPDGVFTILPDRGGEAIPSAINNRGQISGYATDADGVWGAVVWTTRPLQLSPAEQLWELIADVEALVSAGPLNRGQANALRAKLDAATSHLENGRTTPAINVLHAFVGQLRAFVSAGILSPAQGASLEQTALAVIEALQ